MLLLPDKMLLTISATTNIQNDILRKSVTVTLQPLERRTNMPIGGIMKYYPEEDPNGENTRP